jgi:hypothetical protein
MTPAAIRALFPEAQNAMLIQSCTNPAYLPFGGELPLEPRTVVDETGAEITISVGWITVDIDYIVYRQEPKC